MKAVLKKIGWSAVITFAPIIGITALMLIGGLLYDRFGGGVRLYREIGATPWHCPETKIAADRSERYTDEEIAAAIRSVMDTYEKDWYAYNEVYLLELTFDDEFDLSAHRADNAGSERIYLRSVLKCGYSYDMAGTWGRGRVYDCGYWTLEKNSDGTWYCLGWGQA